MASAQRVPCPVAGWAVLLALTTACSNVSPKLYWRQFHGDGPNRGALDVMTPARLAPKWSADLGGMVRFSSIASDASGNLFVAADHAVVKVSPNGQVLWRHDFAPAFATSTPAVADDGSVYVVVNRRVDTENYSNTLNGLSPAGNLLWTRSFGGVKTAPTYAAPKIWQKAGQSALFVYFNGMLEAFSLDGRLLTGLRDTHHCTVIHGSSWFSDVIEAIWNAIKAIGMKRFDVGAITYYELLAWPDPTPAVIDEARGPYRGTPLVVVADLCGMAGFRWDPNDERLSVAWVYNHGDAARLATPAISAVGTLVTVRESGKTGVVEYFDVFHDPTRATKVGESEKLQDDYAGPPAAVWMGAYSYVAGRRHLYRFDGIGQLVSSAAYSGEAFAAPSCSQNWIYVSTTKGLEVFDPALEHHVLLSMAPYGAGVSAPAIARDGTIYVVDINGILRAYR